MRSGLILLAVSFLAFQNVLLQTPVTRNGIGTCPILSSDSDIFGNRTHLSDQGLVPVLFIGGDGTEPLTLRILRVHKLCEAIGLYRNTASSVGFLVEFERLNGNTEIIQVLLDCLEDTHNPNANYSFFPRPDPTDTQLSAQNTPSAEQRTLLRAQDGFTIPTNFSIATELECGLCGSFGGVFANQVTRCISCDTACNKGMNKCLGQGATQCCSYFLNNACVGSCPSPLVPNSKTFDCGCVPLTVNDGAVTYSNEQLIGSVATYSCEGDRGYRLPLGASANRTCKIDEGWTGNDASCVLHDCKMTGLFDPLNGNVTLQSGTTTFGSVATYKCDDDYQLSGVSQRMCTLDGWSGDSPSCVTTTIAVTDTMAPMTDTMAPMTDTMAPMMDTMAPMTDTMAPMTDTMAPMTDTMAPMTTMDIGGTTTQAPPICEVLLAGTKQIISYSNNCTNEIDCQAVYSCEDGYELMGGATVRTCSLPSDRVPVWSGIAPQCQLQSTSLTQPELAGIGIAVAVVGAAVLVGITVIVILVLSKR